jgi:hypothetical protein
MLLSGNCGILRTCFLLVSFLRKHRCMVLFRVRIGGSGSYTQQSVPKNIRVVCHSVCRGVCNVSGRSSAVRCVLNFVIGSTHNLIFPLLSPAVPFSRPEHPPTTIISRPPLFDITSLPLPFSTTFQVRSSLLCPAVASRRQNHQFALPTAATSRKWPKQ